MTENEVRCSIQFVLGEKCYDAATDRVRLDGLEVARG